VGFGEAIPKNVWDPQSFASIRENVDACVKQHKCGQDGALAMLPYRVLWIEADNPSRIQLLEPKNIRAPYIALSYCWGPVDPNNFVTTAATLGAKKAGIEFSELPVLFRDIVDTARELQIEYIWIDRLCIIQGNDEDFKAQASTMDRIHGNATLTIAAASATTEHDSIFDQRRGELLGGHLKANIAGLGELQLSFRPLSHALGNEKSGGQYGKISTRAWIWQERLLAARTIFVTPAALKYECRCYSVWEGYDQGRRGHSWSAQLDNITHQTWIALVEDYMRRNITRPSDRLPAMKAVMKRIEKSTGWSPFWGLWASELIDGLCWSSAPPEGIGQHTCKMSPGYYAPTWSWAGVDGPISYASIKPAALLAYDPSQQDVDCRSLNGASGVIRLSGRVIDVKFIATLSRDTGEDGELGPPRWNYKVSGSSEEEGLQITPDVPLELWTGVLDGKQLSTVARVPYGETPPTESWSIICACLLVSKRRLRCLVLFLGRSMRIPNAWERVGMTEGISPFAFAAARKGPIDIA